MSNHPIVHIELSARDREAAGKFYSTVFGWKVEQIPEMDYATFATGESKDLVGGGFNPITPENPAGTVLVYINADDIDATLAAITANGGKILAPQQEIPTVGWFALFADPTGNKMALFKALRER